LAVRSYEAGPLNGKNKNNVYPLFQDAFLKQLLNIRVDRMPH
jgi:hypothetical protein